MRSAFFFPEYRNRSRSPVSTVRISTDSQRLRISHSPSNGPARTPGGANPAQAGGAAGPVANRPRATMPGSSQAHPRTCRPVDERAGQRFVGDDLGHCQARPHEAGRRGAAAHEGA